MKRERYGNFKISKELIETCPEAVKDVMGKCIITRAEYVWASNCIEYTAISDLFEPLNEGKVIPDYEFRFTEGEGVTVRLL